MEMSVSSEMTFFTTKQQSEICPHLRTGSSAEDRGRIDTSRERNYFSWENKNSYLLVVQPLRVGKDSENWIGLVFFSTVDVERSVSWILCIIGFLQNE